MLLSGSTDGLVSVYDCRIADEDDAVLEVYNHGSSVHRAEFLGDGSVIVALSHDETLSLYPLKETASADKASDEDKAREDVVFGDIRPLADCEYAVDVLRDGSEAIVAVGKHR